MSVGLPCAKIFSRRNSHTLLFKEFPAKGTGVIGKLLYIGVDIKGTLRFYNNFKTKLWQLPEQKLPTLIVGQPHTFNGFFFFKGSDGGVL